MDRLPLAKPIRVKLTGAAYKKLQLAVFAADLYRCKVCHHAKPLQMHHMIRHSKQRLDTVENCISLCARDHELEQRHLIAIEWNNVEERTVKITRRAGS